MLDEARMFGRYVVGLREFVRTPLGREECGRRMGDGGTLRVRRQEPYATAAAEILPLHLLRGA